MARFATTHLMFAEIRLRFNVITRAAQINAFRRLLRFNIRDHASSATINMAITDHLDELHRQNIDLNRDLPGLVLQNGLGSEPEVMREVDRRVELALQASRSRTVPDFDNIVRTVNIVQQNIRHQREIDAEDQPMPVTQPLAMQADTQNSIGIPNAVSPHPDNTPDATDFLAMQAGVCWQCCSPNHMLRDCPLRARNGPNHGPARPLSHHRGYNQYSIPQQHGFQPFYPIVAPAGYTGTYPSVQPPPTSMRPPGPPAPQVFRPGDSYRPQYQNGRSDSATQAAMSQRQRSQPAARMSEAPVQQPKDHSARMVELGNLADDLADLNFGHADVVMAEGALIVDSATEGNTAFITGQGNLQFDGVNNQRVTIHGVLY